MPPTSAFVIAIIMSVLDFRPGQVEAIIKMGAIFCQVVRRMQECQFIELMTWGNQKWKGAAPILIESLIIMSSVLVVVEIIVMFGFVIVRPASRRILDPRAWARKYLMAASVS